METLKVKQFTDSSKLPIRAHQTDAGYDLSANANRVIDPGEWRLIGTGIAMHIPVGYVGYVVPRSGIAARNGLTVFNAPGTVDAGYIGEIMVNLINLSDRPFEIQVGMRIAQLTIHKIYTPEIEIVTELDNTQRGRNGHGSSGL